MFIGNENAKNVLAKFGNSIPHFLIVGPSGHGKTSLVKLATKTKRLIQTSANAIDDHNDMFAFLKQANENDVVFIDEIHSLNHKLQESLYELMESNIFQRISGRGQQKTFENIHLPKFTIAGTTTKEHKLNQPLKNRFLSIHIQPYSHEDLVKIATLNLNSNDFEIPLIIAQHSRNTPRTVVKLCRAVTSTNCKTKNDVLDLLRSLEIYPEGLTNTEIRILKILQTSPASLSSLSAKLMLEEDLVQEEHEPFLIQNSFIERNKNGREITKKGIQYLQSRNF